MQACELCRRCESVRSFAWCCVAQAGLFGLGIELGDSALSAHTHCASPARGSAPSKHTKLKTQKSGSPTVWNNKSSAST